ncbi:MAG: glycosyltransferase [Gammaproteobacteria bacterium]
MVISESKVALLLPSLEGGGTENFIVNLANQLASSNLAVDLVVGQKKGPFLSDVSASVQIIEFATDVKLRVLFKAIKYLRTAKPDIVMSSLDHYNIIMILAAKLAGYKGRKIISQRATIGPVYRHNSWLKRKIYLFLIRITYPQADAIICNSQTAARELSQEFNVDEASLNTIHNWVDIDKINLLAKENIDHKWYQRSKQPLLVSIGSVSPIKDRKTLIEAFAIVRKRFDARLAIIGACPDPNELSEINNLIESKGLADHILVAGFEKNPYKWIEKADLLVGSSTTEGCPNHILEGLALNKAIVATDCPGDTAFLLENGKWGELVPVGNSEKMAIAICAKLASRGKIASNERALHFSVTRVLNLYLEILFEAKRNLVS